MNKELIVAKFGGSSVRDHMSMNRSSAIVASNPSIRVVVISATYNSTNQLESIARLTVDGKTHDRDREFEAFKRRHILIGEFLKAPKEVYELLNIIYNETHSIIKKIEKGYSKELMDALYGIGERVSSCLFTVALQNELVAAKRTESVELVDIRNFIITDDHFGGANPLIDTIADRFKNFPIAENKIIVTQGFIGSTLDGRNTVLGREGSDFSAALIAEALNANTLQIWTDVPGFFTTDPKKTTLAKVIPAMTYDDAETLATLGAKVLFQRTLEPARRKNIPVYVLSSYNPELTGTVIKADVEKKSKVVGFVVDKGILNILLTDVAHADEIKGHFKALAFEKSSTRILRITLDTVDYDEIHATLFNI
jgi:aspartate kinase